MDALQKKNIDFIGLDSKNQSESILERKVKDILQRKFSIDESLICHPLFLPMVGIAKNSSDTINALITKVQEDAKVEYPAYAKIIDSLTTSSFRPMQWRGDFLILKNDTFIHVDVRDPYTHFLNDSDVTPDACRKKLKTILIDKIKENLCAMFGIHALTVNNSNYLNVNKKISKIFGKKNT